MDKKREATIIFLAKSIDGGTGTFYESILRNKKVVFGENSIVPIVLEKPSYRKISSKYDIVYFTQKNYYPEKFALSITHAKKLFDEFIWFKKTIRHSNPDLIITIDTHCAILASIYQLLSNRKPRILVTIHNNVVDTLSVKTDPILRFFMKKVIRYFFNRADKIICVSKHLATNLQEKFNLHTKPTIIYYGIRSPRIELKSTEKRKSKIIVSIGRFEQQKDFPTLINAFSAVAKEYRHPLKLWLVGNGSLKNEYQRLVKKLKLEQRILFFDWQKDPYHFLHQADIFVLSSHREGFPYVLLEALSCHKPIIATDCPFGPREMLDNGKYGKLVPLSDIYSLKQELLTFLTNQKEYHQMTIRAQERSSFFTEEKMVKNYTEIISSFLQ